LGQTLRVKVLFQGKPLSGADVERGDGTTVVAEKDIPRFATDADGIADRLDGFGLTFETPIFSLPAAWHPRSHADPAHILALILLVSLNEDLNRFSHAFSCLICVTVARKPTRGTHRWTKL